MTCSAYEARELLEGAPTGLRGLPAWFASLAPEQVERVWVAAVVDAVEREGGADARALAEALTAARDACRGAAVAPWNGRQGSGAAPKPDGDGALRRRAPGGSKRIDEREAMVVALHAAGLRVDGVEVTAIQSRLRDDVDARIRRPFTLRVIGRLERLGLVERVTSDGVQRIARVSCARSASSQVDEAMASEGSEQTSVRGGGEGRPVQDAAGEPAEVGP